MLNLIEFEITWFKYFAVSLTADTLRKAHELILKVFWRKRADRSSEMNMIISGKNSRKAHCVFLAAVLLE